MFYENLHRRLLGKREGSQAEESLFYWATFVWKIMTNTYMAEADWKQGVEWDPFSLPEGGPSEKALDRRDQLQVLEEARLGNVVLKAWKGQYESVEQVAEDIRKIAEKGGMNVVSSEVEVDNDWMKVFKDEVDIDEPWEAVFELDEAEKKWGARTPKFKKKATHVELPTTKVEA